MKSAPRPAIELTVLIPSNRSLESIAPALDALRVQTLATDRYEVIVVLDGADNGRAAGLGLRRDPYELLAVAGPGRGRAAACNAGLAFARGAVVLLLDDDMVPRPDALAAHLARHAGPGPTAVLGAVPVRMPFDAPFATRYIARRFARHMAKLARPGSIIGARDVYTGACSIPRHILEELGGFNEGFRDYGHEDVELAGRLFRRGVPVVYAPEAVSEQAYRKSFAELAADRVACGRTAVRFLELHPERAGDTGLDRIDRGSRRRLLARRVLSRVARSDRGRAIVVSAAERIGRLLERLPSNRADRFVEVVLDACFHAGVADALHRRAAGARRTVVHYFDSSARGGAERIALTLLTGLDRARWRPILLLHDYPELRPLIDEARAAGIETHIEPPLRPRAGLLGVPHLMRTLRLLRPVAVHVHRAWAPSGTAGILAAALARVPVRVATEQLFLATTPRGVIWLRRLLIDRLVHRHIAVSAAVADAVRTRLHVAPTRITVVANGIAPPEQPAPAAVQAVRVALLSNGARLVVVAAQLRRQKGLETLLDALAELPDVVAAFAGEGPERAGLVERAAAAGNGDRVRFLGFRDDLASVLCAADVVVLPSTAEGMPLVVLEALALGRPVVATAVGGTPEAIRDGVSGLLVPPRDPPALAAAIRSLLRDPVRALQLGEAGRRFVHARYTADRMIRQTARLYEDLLGSAPAALIADHGAPAPCGSS